MPVTQHKKYTNLKFGPDGKLYALMLDGTIERYQVDRSGTATDGTLINLQTIKTLTNKYGTRSAIGLVFDPAATAGNLICYVSHSKTGLVNSPDFDGKISKLMGANLETEQLIITELPRSTRDHMSNSLAFGPDNALYICQGSNSSAGAYDNDWKRAEALLAGAILRLDFDKLNGISLPLDVKTTSNQSVINAAPSNSRFMSDGTYNPYSSTSPLTIYASGVRNAFSLLWHSNGQLYLPTNGSGGGGNSPASVSGTRRPDGNVYSGPSIPATTNIGVQTDWLFRVNPLKNVGYFGHPNPLRGEYVENRGSLDNPLYPANTGPDSRYRGAAYNFGLNHSPNGVIEYKSHSFHDSLLNKLIICRFSGGGDLIVLKPGSLVKDPSITATSDDKIYDIVQANAGIEDPSMIRMSHFTNPLNLVEDIVNGNLFVIEYNWNNLAGMTSQITMLRVVISPSGAKTPVMAVSVQKARDIQGLANFKSYDVKLSNDGEGVLRIKDISVTGTGASSFKVSGINLPQKSEPLIINGKSSMSFAVIAPVNYAANNTNTLRITSIDDSVKDIPLTLLPEVSNSILDSAKSNYTKKLTVAPPAMVLYPNPDRGEQLNVVLKGFKANEDATIYLFNIMGNQLKSLKVKTAADGSAEASFQLPHLANVNMYIVRAVAGSVVKEGKVMVK
jgi:hypothetical protein